MTEPVTAPVPIPVLDADMPAKLYRQDDPPGAGRARGGAEGHGRLADMVSKAMHDPSRELWRYSIAIVGHRLLHAGDILALATIWRTVPERVS